MVTGLLVTVAALVGVAAVAHLLGLRRRRAALARLGPDLTRVSTGVAIRVTARGIRWWPFLDLDRPRSLNGDLGLGRDRFVVTSSHGVLIERTGADGPAITSARCTGPRRLVIEGDVTAGEAPATWRFEIGVDDAEGWAAALAPFVRQDAERRASF
jgi:hypothetical protein